MTWPACYQNDLVQCLNLIPWAFQQFPPWTYRNENGEWDGYCIKLARAIAEKMNFTHDLVESIGFGRRDNVTGRWDGLTGDLIHGVRTEIFF